MMTLNELSNRIELAEVLRENGWGEGISYTVRSTSVTTPGLRAMVVEGVSGDFGYEYKTYGDEMMFLSVFLDAKPVRGDKITREDTGEEYQVLNFVGGNPYDLLTRANTRHSPNRSTRKEK